MAWETRRNGRRYYYRSHRTTDGRVIKEYLGRGIHAQRAADTVASAQASQVTDRHLVASERKYVAAAEATLGRLEMASHLMLDACLLVAGYHRRHRIWRKKNAAP